MEAVEVLRERVAAEERTKAEAEKQRMRMTVERAVARFRGGATVRLGEKVLEELGAVFGFDGGPYVDLCYRGRIRRFKEKFLAGEEVRQVLKWTEEVDEWLVEREEQRRLVLEWLGRCGGEWNDLMDAVVKKYELEEFSEVETALVAAQEEADKRLAAVERLEAVAREQRRVSLLGEVEACTTWEEFREVIDSSLGWEFRGDAKVTRAYEVVKRRLRIADEEREERRLAAEAEGFYPFRYYKVVYGVMAGAECGEQCIVDVESFASLSAEPGEAGWWVTVWGQRVWVAHLVMLREMLVERVEDLPAWCSQMETAWGSIQVVPEGAERLE